MALTQGRLVSPKFGAAGIPLTEGGGHPVRKALALLALLLGVAAVAPVGADEKIATMAIGYSLALNLERGGGVAPFGISLSASSATRRLSPASDTHRIGFEGDFAYHRDEGVRTVTAAAGPRWENRGVTASPFVHVMLLLRHDTFPGASNATGGTMVGFGADMGRVEGARLRLAMDAQLLFRAGRFFEVLRWTAGVAF